MSIHLLRHAMSLANIYYIHSCLCVLHWNIPSISPSSASLPKVCWDFEFTVEFTVFTCLILKHTSSSFCSRHYFACAYYLNFHETLPLSAPVHCFPYWIPFEVLSLKVFFIFLLPVQTFSVTYLFYLLYHSHSIKLGLFSLLWCCPTKFSLCCFKFYLLDSPHPHHCTLIKPSTYLFLHYPFRNAVA